jgi:hypothetical protein
MKRTSNSFIFSLIALACSASLSFSVARAQDDGEQGGNIEGSESMGLDIVMTATAAAPAGSSIEASLEADDENGVTSTKLQLQTQGLPDGTYTVNVTLKSDGSTVNIGTFTLSATSGDGNDDTETTDNEQDGDNNDGGNNDVQFGNDTSLPFPANPFDIATISVLDANNVVLFTADLTNTSAVKSMNLSANVVAKGGSGNPGAAGNALLTAVGTRGSVKGSLQLTGRGLLPSTPLTLALNGKPAKNVRTDKSGNVNVLLKPKGKSATVAAGITLFKVTSVSLKDKFGNVVLGANF